MGVSLGAGQALDPIQIAVISPLANLCRCHIGQIRVTPLAPSGYPLWEPVRPFLLQGGEGRDAGYQRGLQGLIWALTRARACIQGFSLMCGRCQPAHNQGYPLIWGSCYPSSSPLEPYLSPPTPRYALGMSPLASHGCMHAVLRRGYATG